VYDTVIINVVAGIPVVEIDPVIGAFRAGDIIRITSTVTDPFGKSLHIQWDIGGSGIFKTTNSCTLTTFAPDTFAYQYPVVLQATDNSGKRATDTVKVNIIKISGSMIAIPFSQQNAIGKNTFSQDFWMDSTEIAQQMYDSIMTSYIGYASTSSTSGAVRTLPVNNVNWYNAVLFCNARSRLDGLDTVYSYTSMTGLPGSDLVTLETVALDSTAGGYVLPDVTQWEFAYRAGCITSYYWGPQINSAYVWFGQNASGTVHETGTKKSNNFRLYDMAGNVAEWCNNYLETTSAPEASALRIVKGGHWASSYIDVNSSVQKGADPRKPDATIGFRTVRLMEK
jgi:formylglycine-generating enzyme required for sulfatase activity